MAVNIDRSRDQVMAYLCGLTCDCGDNPTLEEAKAYSRRSSSLIDPSSAVEILGVRNWNDVLRAYKRYISGKSLGVSSRNLDRNYGHRYTYDELVNILRELYDEFGGQMSQQMLYERAQQARTPAYTTFVRFLGPMKYWPQIIAEADAKNNTPDKHIAH